MKDHKRLLVGNIDSSVGVFIVKAFELLKKFPYVMISSIDSNRDISQLRDCQKLLEFNSKLKLFAGQLIMPVDVLKEVALKYDLFNGFDEIWLFSQIPKNPLPQRCWITGPREIEIDIPENLLNWMEENHSGLGLGDGIGLNYVTLDMGIFNYIRAGV